ncbi:protein translocase subunit SecF [Patescibacteria group bacterium]|nr:protein translocase subunit SecF [Patescibacteria group bacterium]
MIKIVQRRKVWFGFSLLMILASFFVLAKWDLKYGIDFTGGTLMEFSFKNEILSSDQIKESLKDLELGDVNVQFSGEKDVLLRLKDVDEDTHQKIMERLENAILNSREGNSPDNENIIKENLEEINSAPESENSEDTGEEIGQKEEGDDISVIAELEGGEVQVEDIDIKPEDIKEKNIEEKRFDSIGPVIGNELKSTAVMALVIAIVSIVLYIAWAFRKVSRPVSSFKYGIIATIALFHDVIITLGVFAVLGNFYNVEIGIPFVAALLAILGYSVNDTIVVFDRTRENLLRAREDDFEKTVNKSINETLVRSINTSFTTLLVLFTLFLFGGETIKYFVVALIVGITAGTYSSIFIASPLLVTWQKWGVRKR